MKELPPNSTSFMRYWLFSEEISWPKGHEISLQSEQNCTQSGTVSLKPEQISLEKEQNFSQGGTTSHKSEQNISHENEQLAH